jgi:secretion/DNA translocation related TadE-like protein
VSVTRRDEHGAVTSMAVVLTAVLLAVAVAAVVGGRVLVSERRAAAAADLAALAGAVAVQHGQDGCDAVRRLVSRHPDTEVRRCWVTGEQVRVTVAAEVGVVVGRRVTVAARAHAGPR